MLADGKFGRDIHHGTNSLVWDGLTSSNGELLSGSELQRRGIISRTGEKDIAGGSVASDIISAGGGTDGLGTGRAYAELNARVDGYRSPIYLDEATLRRNIDFYRSAIAKMDEMGVEGAIIPGVNRKTFARLIHEYEEALEIKKRLPGAIKDEPYQIIFGMSGKNLNLQLVERTYGGALSGEVEVLTPKISLAKNLEVIYVSGAKMADARIQLQRVLGPEKAAKVKIYSIESLDMMGGFRGQGNVYSTTFDATYGYLSGKATSLKKLTQAIYQL
jgi:hypothetical protein